MFTRHAHQRMYERGAQEADVIHALMGANRCVGEQPDCWKVTGPDREGDPLTILVVLEAGVLVVTLF
jgi:hypothetical protein